MGKEQQIREFSEEIWRWYAENKRSLPWRDIAAMDDEERAYLVLVSEFMLQQTQVPRVVVLFPRFIERFPSADALAKATNKDVILAWRGLGYNMRALRLRDVCKAVTERYGGMFPRTMNELRSMKGIGEYTAAAIRNFAFNIPTPCIDVNIERIFLRVFYGPRILSRPRGEMLTLAEGILQTALDPACGRDAREWHSALMDFGSLVCTKRNPRYDVCPLMKKGLYMGAYKQEPKTGMRKPEPSRGSVPNRIFRGKVIELLCDTRTGVMQDELGPLLCDDWGAFSRDEEWLCSLVAGLQRDRLLTQRKGGRYVLRS